MAQSKYFSISGFWKNDKVKFYDYIVKEFDGIVEEEEEQIFFYGLSESDIQAAIEQKWDFEEDFVITSYETLINND